jgi:hypothetical protein
MMPHDDPCNEEDPAQDDPSFVPWTGPFPFVRNRRGHLPVVDDTPLVTALAALLVADVKKEGSR